MISHSQHRTNAEASNKRDIAALMPQLNPPYRFKGIVIALAILSLWLAHLLYCLTSAPASPLPLLLHIPIQALLSTGMFITAHDAMHGTVAPGRRRLNDTIGALALFLYAAFPYRTTKGKHWQHHAAPASPSDPDYTSSPNERFWIWLKDFAGQYYSWKNFLVMHIHIAAFWVISGSLVEVILFFAVPAWISALQLFYFGTYLPHRAPKGGHHDLHNAASSDYPAWLSFLTCFHFGYHKEHHHFPFVPWWRLPRVHARMR